MNKLSRWIALLGLLACGNVYAAGPALIYCVQASLIACNSLSGTSPYSGNQGDFAYQFNTKTNNNFTFLGPLWNLSNGQIVGNSSGGSGALNAITLGSGLTLTGNVLSATGSGSGSLTSFSFATANGFSGTVSNPTTTPSLTLNTTFTGIGYSNGTGFAAAVAGNFPTLNQSTSGNAATATLATTATNLAGGTQYQIPYQNAAGTTLFAPAPTLAGTQLNYTGSGYSWVSASGSVNSCSNANYMAYYAAIGSTVSCLPLGNALTLNGGILNVSSLVNAQTGTSYAIATTDNSKLVTASNAAAMAYTIVAASTTGYTAGFAFDLQNYGPGTLSLTPATSTIGGNAALFLGPNQGCSVVSDGTNYQVSACSNILGSSQGGAGTSITPGCSINNEPSYGTFTAATGTFTVNAPTGCVPFEAQTLIVHAKFSNSQTASFNATYAGGTAGLPSTFAAGELWLGFRWSSIANKWDLMGNVGGF